MTEDTELDQLSVHEAVARVLADMPAIEKGGTAPANMGGYKFRRVEDITAALKPLFAKYGVLCVPSVMQRIESERTTAASKILYCVDLEICFRFVGPQGDELAANVWGQGTDSGDKATQKAVTSAFKTMLSVVFCISDSEMDAEAHDVPETHRPTVPARPAPAPKEVIDDLVDRIAEASLADWVRDQGFAWPWTPEACAAIQAKLDEFYDFDPDKAPQAPPGPPGPDRPPDPPAAPTAPPGPPAEPVAAASVEEIRAELEARLTAEVAALTTVELTKALGDAGLGVDGNPALRRARLVDWRFGQAMTADVI